MSDQKELPRLGYWALKGLAEPIRLFLRYNEVQFAEDVYTQGDPPELSREEWYSSKRENAMGLDFPTLPYLIHGDVKLTETHAILFYCHQLATDSKTPMGAEEIMLLNLLRDMRSVVTGFCYGGSQLHYTGPASATTFLDGIFSTEEHTSGRGSATLLKMSNYLGTRDWLSKAENAGPGCADFMLYEHLKCLVRMALVENTGHTLVSDVGRYKNLALFVERVEQLETLKDYINSEEVQQRPWNNKSAKWGGNKQL
jgi:glutathione S-transferase